jgi:hypothetical protein
VQVNGTWQAEYGIKDHLSNARVTIRDVDLISLRKFGFRISECVDNQYIPKSEIPIPKSKLIPHSTRAAHSKAYKRQNPLEQGHKPNVLYLFFRR